MNDVIANKSILAVDDDPRMLRALEKVLRDEGINVIAAAAADQAVEILTARKGNVDLLITDLRMPAGTGLTLISSVRERFPTLPVIVLTAFGSPYVRSECLRQGAVAFLEKPIQSQALLEAVAKAVSRA